MREDEEGFLYPEVDDSRCTKCGICAGKCQVITGTEQFRNEPFLCYGLIAKDRELLFESSSGGAFGIFAKTILNQNGIVFGAAFGDRLFVHHTAVLSHEDLHILHGSKYVESDTADSFSKAKQLLDSGRHVLYSGTPCQIAGLRVFLGKEYDNLLTLDLICHGVPSFKLFRKYLDWLEEKYKSSVVKYGFRDKSVHPLGAIKIEFQNGRIVKRNNLCDPYGTAFARWETYRESCYTCPFANLYRVSDITIGDFWGIENSYPNFDGTNGVSIVLLNTNKGKAFFENIKDECKYITVKKSEIVPYNPCLNRPENRPEKYTGIDKLPLHQFMKKFPYESQTLYSLKAFLKSCFIKLLPEKTKHWLGRLLNG